MRSNEWRKSFIDRLLNFASEIVLLTDKLPRTPAGFAIASQLVRSGTSIGANFVESQDASSTKDFIQKLTISLREARETWYWLKVIEGTKILSVKEIKQDIEECNQIIGILVTSIKSSKSKAL